MGQEYSIIPAELCYKINDEIQVPIMGWCSPISTPQLCCTIKVKIVKNLEHSEGGVNGYVVHALDSATIHKRSFCGCGEDQTIGVTVGQKHIVRMTSPQSLDEKYRSMLHIAVGQG
jgi:hypothetical protein